MEMSSSYTKKLLYQKLGKVQTRSDGMCKLEWNFKVLPKALWIYARGISFHSWKFLLYSLCIQEHFNAEILCFMSTLFKSPSVKLLHNVSYFVFARLFPHRKVFCIWFSSSRTEFAINEFLSFLPVTIVSCSQSFITF